MSSSAQAPPSNLTPDKENHLDVDAHRPSILVGIPNMVNGHIIAITIARNVMRENSPVENSPSQRSDSYRQARSLCKVPDSIFEHTLSARVPDTPPSAAIIGIYLLQKETTHHSHH